MIFLHTFLDYVLLCSFQFGVVLHELGHALGRFHEQTRPDRGDHVNIIEGNIMSGYAHNFKIAERPTPADYDLQSIMHYSYNVNMQNVIIIMQ